jgi:hypothetical protein
MRNKIITLLILFVVSSSAMAQRKVFGIVADAKDSTALPGATIKCIVDNDKTANSVVAGDRGIFVMDLPHEQGCKIEVSFVGFDTYSIAIKGSKKGDTELGHIYLTSHDNKIEGVTVSSNLKRIDRELLFPSANQLRVSNDVFTLLESMNLRGMQVDVMNKSASVNGRSPQWKVNGIPKSIEEVKNIRPKDILRIEYSDMPSMREMDRGFGGVINIILKVKSDGGYVSANATSAFTTGFADGGTEASYNKGKSSFTLNYSASYRDYDKWKRETSSQFISPKETVVRDMKGLESPFGYLSQNIDFNYVIGIDQKTMFSATLKNPIYYQHGDIGEIYGNNILRHTKSSFHGYTPSLDLYLSRVLSHDDRIELNVVGTLGIKGRSRYNLTDRMDDGTTQEYAMPVDTKRRSLISELYYIRPFKSGTALAIGVQNTLGYSHNDYFVPDEYRDKLNENNTYTFAQLWGKIWKIQYSAGTGLKYNYLNNGTKKQRYWKNQSSVSLFYAPKSNLYLQYSFYYYPSLPGLYATTEVSKRIDDLQMLKGNPDLKASNNFYNSIAANYTKGIFNTSLTVMYLRSTDPIFLHIGYDDANGYFTQSYINGKSNSQFNVEVAPSLRGLFNFMNIYGRAGYNRFWSKTADVSHAINNYYWSLTMQLYYKKFSLSANYAQPKKTLYDETISRDEKVSRISLQWNGKNIVAWCCLYNLFMKNGANYLTESISKYNPGRSKVTIRDNGNMITLGLSWNMSFGKKFNKASRSINNADNGNSLLKVKTN